ncbi:NADH-quinone oxidoreductase subunit NuoF [Bordetella sp. LUAb4]|uniref:formate dehydrogenase beta subunit n=1 Tax=Bordetella sp. LUAb4 TaxID=2843195 RepID=UPI001E306DA7|nr:NADH-quinone oxidoreductase subunit NuoF [Bordetella sp. LUAb4]
MTQPTHTGQALDRQGLDRQAATEPPPTPDSASADQPVTIYVPRDAAALAVGADAVALAISTEAARRGLTVSVVRNGSRGLLWLETLVEVATPAGRMAYGPVDADDVPGLFDAGWLTSVPNALDPVPCHALGLGLTEAIPYLKRQERLTFARVGIIDPRSVQDYEAHGGLAGLRRAAAMAPAGIVEEILQSGLRGRGGAAFPTGIKWKTVAAASATQKYIVCNADEGDSGTFADRLLMEGDPFVLIEGMAIAGLAVGATYGYIYVRSEYPQSIEALNAAITAARAAGWLGDDVCGSGRRFDLEVRVGAGAYICGEETSLLESLEGKRGVVRAKPPLPAIAGLFGKPTVINNVISLASVPVILARGAQHYRDYGVGRSAGTLPFQLAGNLRQGGLVEKAFGLTLRELLYDFGGGSASGRPLRAVQVGGPLGAYLPESQWDIPLDYEAYAAASAMIGHGGLVAFDDSVDMLRMARYAMEFCAIESCGKCTPCRIGSTRGVETLDRIAAGGADHGKQVVLLRDLCDTMLGGSLCALGGMAPFPVLSALNHFPQDFGLDQGMQTKQTETAPQTA